MTTRPEVHYARAGEDYVAYQVVGDGPVDLVYQGGWHSHCDVQWDVPEVARFLEGLASFSRLIVFDRRGHGMSDRVDLDNLTLEASMEDITAVMDACSSERAAIVGVFESGPAQILYSATHPERTVGLVLINTSACVGRAVDYPEGMPERTRRRVEELMGRYVLGEDNGTFAVVAPASASDALLQDSYRRLIRVATNPGTMEELMRWTGAMDVRHVLPSVRSPTMILHSLDQPYCRVGHGRYLAEHIEGAKYVELHGGALYPWLGDQEAVLSEIEEFVTGVRPVREPDRVLSTVLFTDIVGSTEHASAMGDRRWRELLDAHNAEVSRQLERHNGLKVSSIGRGDGVLATFDGPARAVRCARSIVETVASLGIEVRAGLHTGEIERRKNDIGGIAVHIADRVAAIAGPGEVLVSRTVVDLVVGSDLRFADRGAHSLKGVPNEWQLYAVER